ncbi:MAG: hypothetical protein Q4D16_24455 [Eubacteriales bacterium]|nr:hypothetical protein [Eubacteriales bacterium]
MYGNTNNEVVSEIARGNMNSHKLRNAMAVLAIMLTTLLITVVCTVGISFYETIERGSDISPGPMADGGINTDISFYEEVEEMDEVEWAGYVRPCNLGSLHNREMIGINAKLYVPNESYLKQNQIELKQGRFPESGRELAVSDTMAERLGITGAGDTVTLRPLIVEDGQQKEIEVPMEITGIYTSPMEPLHTVYEEMYTGESFLSDIAPEMADEKAIIYVKLASGQEDKYDALNGLALKVGAQSAIYKTHSAVDIGEIILVAGFLLLIMFCGYLIIYNIFYISVVNDIRFLGMMKTIGTTGTQVKKILSWQVRRLAVAGIVLGLIAGYFTALAAAPAVMAQTNYSDFYQAPDNPWGFAAAALFAALTVLVSCRKSYRIASRISPVEAARYTGSGKSRRKLWSVLSFGIGGMIFLIVYTATIGYDVEKIVDRYHTADVCIDQDAMEFGSDEAYQPVTAELVEELKNLPYIENISVYYQARMDDKDMDNAAKEGRIPMKAEGKWKTDWEDFLVRQKEMIESMGVSITPEDMRASAEDENGNVLIRVMGMPVGELAREEENIILVDGSFNEEKFATGDYIIYNQLGNRKELPGDEFIHAGDKLTVSLYDLEKDAFVTAEKEVMAVYTSKNQYAASIVCNGDIVMPDNIFAQMFPQYGKWISCIQADAEQELSPEQYQEINDIVQGTFNSQLSIQSRYETRQAQQKTKNSMTMIGLFLAGIFGIIGIANVVNTLVTGVMTRKLEYAAMQSVGMTKKQMCLSLIGDGGRMAGVSTVLAIAAAGIFGSRLVTGIGIFSGFSSLAFLQAAGILVIVLVVMTVSVAVLLSRFLNRKPIVERLREAE